MTHLIGVSSGIFGAVSPEERLAAVSVGLFRKAQYCITKGVEFVQLDLESVSEFKEPDLKINMEKIKRMGITFGIHSETRAFGVEVAELDSAIETDYKFGHERLREILEKAGEIGSKYVLIHSSESQPFLFLERHLQPAALVDFFGRDFGKFLKENPDLIDWLMGGKIENLTEKIFEVWLEKRTKIKTEDIAEVMPSQNFIWIEVVGYSLPEIIRRIIDSLITEHETREGGIKYDTFSEKAKKYIDGQIKTRINATLIDYRNHFFDHIRSRRLAYGPERFAYWLIAKWMEKNKDPLWTNIINDTAEYFADVEDQEVDEWLSDKGIKKLSIDDDNFRQYSYLWVPAVSAKYIWGHLNNPDTVRYPDLKEIIDDNEMPLVLETPMAHRGVEEWLRLPNPIQMFHLVKEVGEDYLQIALDFEHMISIRLEPEKVIDALPDDGGKFVKVIHAGWPSPLAPAHIPIPLGSEQQTYLYKMLYKLREKGFGKDKEKEWFVVFERGGGLDPIKQSVLALREIVKFLEKDVAPEKLPPEFFGIAAGELASEERQLVTIKEHMIDPLKGVLAIPEEEYTFLSKAAAEKGKAEFWKKEKLK